MVGNMHLPQWGADLMTTRDNTTFIHYIGYVLVMGLLVASAATNVGHELTHRKRNKFDMFIGNWLLALTWDCAFAIEHVYGHHKYLATDEDPATARTSSLQCRWVPCRIHERCKRLWQRLSGAGSRL